MNLYICNPSLRFLGNVKYNAEEMKALCEKYNLEPVSCHHVHRPILEDLEGLTDYMAKVGMKYCAIILV